MRPYNFWSEEDWFKVYNAVTKHVKEKKIYKRDNYALEFAVIIIKQNSLKNQQFFFNHQRP